MKRAPLKDSSHHSLRRACSVLSACALLSISSQFIGAAEQGTGKLDAIAADVVINADSHTFDSHPSSVTTSDGTTWMAWHG